MTDEEDLQDRSMRTRLSSDEFCRIAHILAQPNSDPLSPEDFGEPFACWDREAIFELCDFTTLLKQVPWPYAQVDLLRAWTEFWEDKRNFEFAIEKNIDLEQTISLLRNCRHWFVFWSVRHPCSEARANFVEALKEIDVLSLPVRRKAEAHLARNNILIFRRSA